MQDKLKSYAVLFFTLLMLCAFVMPAFCAPAHAHDQGSTVTNMTDCDSGAQFFKKTDASKDHKQGQSSKSADHCCIAHHCCSAKMVTPLEFKPFLAQAKLVVLTPFIDQAVSGLNINSLDRPPKSLV